MKEKDSAKEKAGSRSRVQQWRDRRPDSKTSKYGVVHKR